ncbi:uncharacterized protein LOC113294607 [Papaver somniferum]|uniref:uncharacterized protein LOC113294607 n=1 Tax=Papaver somniferum TaxID=3469 RepID=UPI000E6FA6F9|nr:uncharacterized protein LOC113294607 [Papaver somniferum]
MNDFVKEHLNMKVQKLLQDGVWMIPEELRPTLENRNLPVVSGGNDKLFWIEDVKGVLNTSSVVNRIREKEPKLHWPTKIRKPFMHPSISSNVWKIIQGIYVDDVKRVHQGFQMVSKCCICKYYQDSMSHLLWSCSFSVKIWSWLGSIFGFSNPLSFDDIWNSSKQKSSLIKEIWLTAACSTVRELWFQKNMYLFDNISPCEKKFKCRVWQLVHEGWLRMKGTRWELDYDLQIIEFFKLGPRCIKYREIRECSWNPPSEGDILFCCDGISLGNPGNAGFGIIARDYICQVVGTLSGWIGVANNYITKIMVVVCAIEWAVSLECNRIIIYSESKTVISDFKNNKVPWFIFNRWAKACNGLTEIQYHHRYKEVNFSANSLAKDGALLRAEERISHIGRPQSVHRIEMPGVKYYRCC